MLMPASYAPARNGNSFEIRITNGSKRIERRRQNSTISLVIAREQRHPILDWKRHAEERPCRCFRCQPKKPRSPCAPRPTSVSPGPSPQAPFPFVSVSSVGVVSFNAVGLSSRARRTTWQQQGQRQPGNDTQTDPTDTDGNGDNPACITLALARKQLIFGWKRQGWRALQ
jgi:hypothetical protein